MHRMLWKDIFQAITGSWPRFVSIACLMLLGTFAFVGLKVTGPDMRATAASLYSSADLADATVVSSWALDDTDRSLLDAVPGARAVEYGYLVDTVVDGTDTSVRVLSTPEHVSRPILVSGALPDDATEIALDYRMADDYAIGETIALDEPTGTTTTDADSSDGDDSGGLLVGDTFAVVGFVRSAEFIDREQLGATTVGTGQLNYFAMISPDAFDSDVYLIARISYDDTVSESPYDDAYLAQLDAHTGALNTLLADQPQARLEALVTDRQADLDASRAELDAAQAQLEQAASELHTSAEQLAAARAQLDQLRAAGASAAQVEALSASIDAQQTAYAGTDDQLAAQQQDVDDKAADLEQAQADLDALSTPTYTVADRRDLPGYERYGDNSERIDVLSEVFPVFLFAISALVSLTTMTRMVDEHRITNGTFAALGYTPRQIRRKYLVYGITASLLGATAGVALGHTLLPNVIFRAYAAHFVFPALELTFHPVPSIIATVVAVACTVLVAAIVATRELREVPARLLLPKPPAAGTRIVLERIGRLWRRMTFTQKVTARNLFRYMQRSLMTIFGVAGCAALLIVGFGLHDSLAGIVQTQFGSVLHYDLIAVTDEDATEAQRAAVDQTIGDSEAIAFSTAVHYEQLHVAAGSDTAEQDITLLVPADPDAFSDDVTLRDRSSGAPITLDDDGVVISEKLATMLGVTIGDTIDLTETENVTRMLTVSAVTEMYVGHYVFADGTAYKAVFGDAPSENARLITLADHSQSAIDTESAALVNLDGMYGVVQVAAITSTIESIMQGLNNVILVLIICAILLALVVIFNLTNINVSERIRELSTIKVLGFYPREVTLYIYRETLTLTILGILAGYAIGIPLHRFIINALPPGEVMFEPDLFWTNFTLAAAITLGISLIIMIVVHLRLARVNMLDALKSVE